MEAVLLRNGLGAFAGCDNLKTITFEEGTEKIANFLFSGCNAIKEIEIPEGVKYIGSSAFSKCENLTKVTMPDTVITIEGYAFRECKKLTEVELNQGLRSIGKNAFQNCAVLSCLKLPDTVQSIHENVFLNCTGLSKVAVPESVTYIGTDTFLNDGTTTIYGSSASYVERYAEENGIPFVPMEQLKAAVTSSESYVEVGEKVVLKAKASGGSGCYQYHYLIYNVDTNQWSRLTPSYGGKDTFEWTAGSAGTRAFYVEVKDTAGKIVRSSAINVVVK